MERSGNNNKDVKLQSNKTAEHQQNCNKHAKMKLKCKIEFKFFQPTFQPSLKLKITFPLPQILLLPQNLLFEHKSSYYTRFLRDIKKS